MAIRSGVHPAAYRSWRRAIVTVFLVAACSHNKDDIDADADVRPEPIPIHVKNENFLDMNVSVVANGVTRRLGLVSGNSSGDFTINWTVANGTGVSVTATPIGGSGRYLSQALNVRPGQVIEFRVGSVLRQSAAIVRDP